MPTKGSFTSNVFEDLKDLSTSAAKSAAQAVVKPVNPVKIIEEIVTPAGTDTQVDKNAEKLKEQQNKGSSTPLDFDKLNNKYQENDQKKLIAVRKQFQLVKQGEQQAIDERKKEEQEREKKFAMEEQEKKKKEEERRRAENAAPIPAGKQRRSLFSPKKKAQMQHQETKPSVGKQ